VTDESRTILTVGPIMAAVSVGGYALLCHLTDTWQWALPSQHITNMALIGIGGFIFAVVYAFWGKV
jgi:hypothetical protein